ncbi:hypothetical protein B0H14DRAFT_3172306 [Mycena olivaceomarginata]|nr:hypothetical protein B0H14DRAFT_3172306 [Mycena olivaceomarginata]
MPAIHSCQFSIFINYAYLILLDMISEIELQSSSEFYPQPILQSEGGIDEVATVLYLYERSIWGGQWKANFPLAATERSWPLGFVDQMRPKPTKRRANFRRPIGDFHRVLGANLQRDGAAQWATDRVKNHFQRLSPTLGANPQPDGAAQWAVGFMDQTRPNRPELAVSLADRSGENSLPVTFTDFRSESFAATFSQRHRCFLEKPGLKSRVPGMHGLSNVPCVHSAPQKSSGTLNFLQGGAILFQEGPPFSRKTRVEILACMDCQTSPVSAQRLRKVREGPTPPIPAMHGLPDIPCVCSAPQKSSGGRDFLAAILFQEGPTPLTFSRKPQVEISSPWHAWTVKRPLRPLSTSGTVIFLREGPTSRMDCQWAPDTDFSSKNPPLKSRVPGMYGLPKVPTAQHCRKFQGERFHRGRARCRVGMRLAGTEGLGWLGLVVRNERGGGSLGLFLEKRGLKPRVPGMHGLPMSPSKSPACGRPAQLAPRFRRPDGTKTDQKSLQFWQTDWAKAGSSNHQYRSSLIEHSFTSLAAQAQSTCLLAREPASGTLSAPATPLVPIWAPSHVGRRCRCQRGGGPVRQNAPTCPCCHRLAGEKEGWGTIGLLRSLGNSL